MEEFLTLRSRRPASSADSTYGSSSETSPLATHDISRVSYHVKHLESFAEALQESATRAFPNRGRSQRYSKVQALMLHWKCDDLFVLPELEDLEKCLRDDYAFETETFAIPSENAHLELMLKLGDMIKKHESEDTLFLVYYGGHARIDESRQSTWCATRHPGSPWLQWSAIQTLLERSASDVLILLDCCAGAASATFPTGSSITETISASSWDAIAPDPGRYSFTNALIEVLQEWRVRTFSAAMLHAEVLARLKHPRPIRINGKHFEARSTPVHFMMTTDHRAPSIEIGRIVPQKRLPPTPPKEPSFRQLPAAYPSLSQEQAISQELMIPSTPEPNEDQPHVMISLALEEDQRLDINAWQQWLGSFPALAKYVKVQGVFKSHSTLLLLSLPVMVWDLLPNDPACSFIAFIRSNNLIGTPADGTAPPTPPSASAVDAKDRTRADTASWMSGTTVSPLEGRNVMDDGGESARSRQLKEQSYQSNRDSWMSPGSPVAEESRPTSAIQISPMSLPVTYSSTSLATSQRGSGVGSPHAALRSATAGSSSRMSFSDTPSGATLLSHPKSAAINSSFDRDEHAADGSSLSKHVVKRLEGYFLQNPEPTTTWVEVLSSNLGVDTTDVHSWFHHRRESERMKHNLQSLRLGSARNSEIREGAVQMILPGHLNTLLEIYPSKSVLVVDLRSATDFEKSHIHDAVNLRAPFSFVENMSLEMIEDTFMDDQSRRSFSKWSQCRCVVFYDRVVEFDWECPGAEALYDKFRKKGWRGQGFILKGHYREFSASFDKYISGSKMTKEAKQHLDGLRQQSSLPQEEVDDRHRRYDEWLRNVMTEERVPQRTELIPARKMERRRAVEQHQKELESEFEVRFPALFRKVMAMGKRADSPPPASRSSSPPPPFFEGNNNPGAFRDVEWGDQDNDDSTYADTGYGDRYDRKAALVQPLVSGLERIRREAAVGGSYPGDGGCAGANSYVHADKLDMYPDDYDEIDPKSEGLKNDPLFQRAGAGGSNKTQESGGGRDGGAEKGDGDVKQKGGKVAGLRRPPLWERLRSGAK